MLLDTLFTLHALDLTKDKLVFTGDYVDRGADSYGVLCRIQALQEQYPDNVVVLAGNHEWINIMYYTRHSEDDVWMWENNGGPETAASYLVQGFTRMTDGHLRWLAHLPFFHEEPGFFFSHAPAPRDSYRNILHRGLELTPDELIWTYHKDERGVARDHGNGIVGVCGHIHALKKGIMAPRFYDHYIYGDSGAGCSDKAPLCAIDVRTREVIYAWPP